jgi:hypothetical protein
MKNFLIGVLLVVIAILVYLQINNKKTDTIPVAISPENTATNISPDTIKKTVWGVSFEKRLDYEISQNTDNLLWLQEKIPDGNTIKVEYIEGNSITDTDAKFGSITYSFDTNKQIWVETNNMEGEGTTPHTTPVKAVAENYTADNLPLFKGVGRWKTYIIPLSETTFLKLNIKGDGQTKPLDDLVKTIRKI